MKIPFHKMHGAGNDFIMVDDRSGTFPVENKAFIARFAARRTGIGCDGIILLQPSETSDLRMRFINPDGGEQDMCGNGARCFARLAHDLGAAPAAMSIETRAGVVHAKVFGELVRIGLTDPSGVELDVDCGLEWPVDFVDTGVPHAVVWVEDVESLDVQRIGKTVRNHSLFMPNGTNANFARLEQDGSLTQRTYERGVEAETFACGTGAAATAVVAAHRGLTVLPATVHCAGGHDLLIDTTDGRLSLSGGAEYVYSGEVEYGNRV